MRVALLACVTLALCGCASPFGLVYTHTFEPLSTDYHRTPVVSDQSAGDVKQIQYYVRVSWSSNGIGEIAKEYGFDEVYYADLETLSVLGIWEQQWAHVYGTRSSAPSPAGTR